MERAGEFFYIHQLPPYPLGDIAQAVRTARAAGRDIIDLSQVNPDLGPPGFAVDSLVQACLQPHNHRYSSSQGITRLREGIAKWYAHRHGVELAVDSEVVATMGTKEGLSHLLLAVASPRDNILVPTPSYPIHTSAVFIAGAGFVGLPLFSSNELAASEGYTLTDKSSDFFERLSLAYNRTWPRPKLMVVSFPHNPTTTVVTLSFFERLVEFALAQRMYIVHDFAYADIAFDGTRPPSILKVPGAREVAVECYSLSKGMGIPGWRIGFCLGNRELVGALKKIKSYLDFGIYQPLQIAAAQMLSQPERLEREAIGEVVTTYQSRRDLLYHGLQALGWECAMPSASVFIWARIPERFRKEGSLKLSYRLLEETGIAVCPGAGFDVGADEFVRFALVERETRLRIALEHLSKLN